MTRTQAAILLIAGAVLGVAFVRAAFALRRHTAQILVAGLIIAALAYVLFAFRAQDVSVWLPLELLGVAIYGALGFLGLRRSPWWLVAGWALHPAWDIALHYTGPGGEFAPLWYILLCVTFDVAVAGHIAHRITLGWTARTEQAFHVVT
jgi:hypothetical protein